MVGPDRLSKITMEWLKDNKWAIYFPSSEICDKFRNRFNSILDRASENAKPITNMENCLVVCAKKLSDITEPLFKEIRLQKLPYLVFFRTGGNEVKVFPKEPQGNFLCHTNIAGLPNGILPPKKRIRPDSIYELTTNDIQDLHSNNKGLGKNSGELTQNEFYKNHNNGARGRKRKKGF